MVVYIVKALTATFPQLYFTNVYEFVIFISVSFVTPHHSTPSTLFVVSCKVSHLFPMSTFNPESEFERQSRERERSRESKESRESFEMDEQAEAAAAMERADLIVKDVKSTKNQMKNIVMNMHAVKQQIKQLRQQLQLADSDDSSSLQQDQKRVDELKEKIAEYQKEIIAMRGDLIREQTEELLTQGFVGDAGAEAERLIDRMIGDVESE